MDEPEPTLPANEVENLLDQVTDLPSFIVFVNALAQERSQAEDLERKYPVRYSLGGAYRWQNGSIQDFLWAALVYFDDPVEEDRKKATWRNFANFLYMGKIYE